MQTGEKTYSSQITSLFLFLRMMPSLGFVILLYTFLNPNEGQYSGRGALFDSINIDYYDFKLTGFIQEHFNPKFLKPCYLVLAFNMMSDCKPVKQI